MAATETNSQTGTVLYTYDTNWHLASIKDERGFVTGFVHDVNGNLFQEGTKTIVQDYVIGCKSID